jgi:hypothetical protein
VRARARARHGTTPWELQEKPILVLRSDEGKSDPNLTVTMHSE